ncbi:hypothetical protein [Paraclostridium bifermentans]|uniref:hypothetical protein n=1 Tax=Paraclostridium bifermentans TaxID=1490 RepID=UPI001C7F29C5|nr:hypothetical protein [Paraclostridium bifermentans]GIM32710.1 hypothetical protein PAGU1678_19800 [Paraclostridium bifermentans subsp. muricolitidis]
MSGFKLNLDPIANELIKLEIKSRASLGLLGDSIAKDMEAYAKTNRPWGDISGDARDRLHGDSQNLGNKVRCSISHGIDYGVYLEMCNEGKYRILKPTIDAVGPKAVRGLDRIFK